MIYEKPMIMNYYLHHQYIETKSKFLKFSNRLQRSQEKGEFQRLSKRKQHFLVSRVKKLWEKLRLLEVQLKICTAGVSLALLLMVSNAGAQDQFVYAPDKNPMPPPTISGWDPVLVDLDSDGDLDMFLTDFSYYIDPRVIYYKNTGTSTAPDFQKVPDNENPFRALTFDTDFQSWDADGMGDVDGDGDVDILSDDGFLLRNVGGSDTPLFAAEASGLSNTNLQLGDIDGDGDLDIMEVTYDGYVSVSPNIGNATTFTIDENNPVSIAIGNWNAIIDGVYFTRVVDLDGDGDLDMLFGGELYDYDNDIFWENYIFIAENTGTNIDPVFTLLDDADNPYLDYMYPSFRVGDLDGDGDFDALVFDYGSGIRYFELNNDALSENKAQVPGFYDGVILPMNYYYSPVFADVDGDGDPDVITINYFNDSNLSYFEYQETGQQVKYVGNDQKEITLLNDEFLQEFPIYVDMDGDGDLDGVAFVYDYYGEKTSFHYFENTGTAQSPVYEAALNNPVLEREWLNVPSFADIDGDGDTDIFLSYEVYDDVGQTWLGVTSFYENMGGNELAFTERTGAENPIDLVKEETYPFIDYVLIQFGDIDEDGDLDLAFTDYDGTIFYLENTGSKTEPNFVDKSDNSPFTNIWAGYYGKINLVDMDKDGDLDLMVHTYYGMIAEYYENTGAPGGTNIPVQLSPEQLEVFPNPVMSDITIRMNNELRGEMAYEIVSVHGKQVFNGTIEKPGETFEFKVTARDLTAGLYFIKIWNENQLYLSKFVKR